MTRGELPEIPHDLQESVRSAEAYEQDVRRDFQISDYARKRQIPESSMENATVRRFVTVLRDADAAKDRLGRFEATEFVKETDPLAYERMGQASLLYAAEVTILEEGFQASLPGDVVLDARPIDIDPKRGNSLTKRLDRVGKPFGVSVAVPEGWSRRRSIAIMEGRERYRPTPPPVEGVWIGAPFTTAQEEPWRRQDGRDHLWYWP